MMNKYCLRLILPFIVLTLLVSCHKEEEKVEGSRLKIREIMMEGRLSLTFNYNGDLCETIHVDKPTGPFRRVQLYYSGDRVDHYVTTFIESGLVFETVLEYDAQDRLLRRVHQKLKEADDGHGNYYDVEIDSFSYHNGQLAYVVTHAKSSNKEFELVYDARYEFDGETSLKIILDEGTLYEKQELYSFDDKRLWTDDPGLYSAAFVALAHDPTMHLLHNKTFFERDPVSATYEIEYNEFDLPISIIMGSQLTRLSYQEL